MTRSSTIALALVAACLGAASANERSSTRMDDLAERGFAMVAEGKLLESSACRVWSMRIIGSAPDQPCNLVTTYGSFTRMKKDESEFVCVSFRDWTCFAAETKN